MSVEDMDTMTRRGRGGGVTGDKECWGWSGEADRWGSGRNGDGGDECGPGSRMDGGGQGQRTADLFTVQARGKTEAALTGNKWLNGVRRSDREARLCATRASAARKEWKHDWICKMPWNAKYLKRADCVMGKAFFEISDVLNIRDSKGNREPSSTGLI